MHDILSGAVSRKDQVRMDKHAALFYDEVRKRRGDEYKIAQNTGFAVEDIELIKSHMFSTSTILETQKESWNALHLITIKLYHGNV